jgi:hypothetical protein
VRLNIEETVSVEDTVLVRNAVKFGVDPVPEYEAKLVVTFRVYAVERRLCELTVKICEFPSNRLNVNAGDVVREICGVFPVEKPVPETVIRERIISINESFPELFVIEMLPFAEAELMISCAAVKLPKAGLN